MSDYLEIEPNDHKSEFQPGNWKVIASNMKRYPVGADLTEHNVEWILESTDIRVTIRDGT